MLTRLVEPSVRGVIEPLANVGRAARSGISDLEIGYSARNEHDWDELVGTLDAFVIKPCSRGWAIPAADALNEQL